MPIPGQKRTVSPKPMPGRTIDFDTVRKIGLALPGVEDSTAYRSPALKVRGKLLACIAAHRSAEPGSLVVSVDFDDRAELLAADPDVYYVTDHYVGNTSVLVRLSRVNLDVLRDLLGMAHKFVTRNAAPRCPQRKQRSHRQQAATKPQAEKERPISGLTCTRISSEACDLCRLKQGRTCRRSLPKL